MIKPSDLDLSNLVVKPTERPRGPVVRAVGLVLHARIENARIGNICRISRGAGAGDLIAEVVGFTEDLVTLMPLGDTKGLGPGCPVEVVAEQLDAPVGDGVLGRVLDGLGQPIDGGPPVTALDTRPVDAPAPAPLSRAFVRRPLATGVRVIDALLTCGEGQRMGLFAGAGVGKSTLLGMICRNTEADVNVIALIGERGKEVRDFIEESLGREGLARSVVVVTTSDRPAVERLRGALVATTIAERFRDQGKKVMLMVDSVTRFARALREVGLAAGEPPARQGFPPSVFAMLPRLLERAGNSDRGSITAFYTVLVEGDDMREPISAEVQSILDGHIILDREIAARGQYPAIDVLRSKSRVVSQVCDRGHLDAARQVLSTHALYEENRMAIAINAVERGNPLLDHAIQMQPMIEDFLKQRVDERIGFADAVARVRDLAAACAARATAR